ncbi:hypothetical protein [Streptomyces mirabilis]|uniref:hypothetical protein n=1 Tax=Streptomyces mirabilis TaxID=68239 RepID=UPI0033FFA010
MVIGGGQAGLAAGYHLRRLGIEFVLFARLREAIRLARPAAGARRGRAPGR